MFLSRCACFVRQIATAAASTEKLRDSARTFEKGLLLDEFCAILFMPNNSIFTVWGLTSALMYPLFSHAVKNCLATLRVHFAGVPLIGSAFFILKKIFQKTFEKSIGVINF